MKVSLPYENQHALQIESKAMKLANKQARSNPKKHNSHQYQVAGYSFDTFVS
jgi:hypothetical protein